MEHAQLRAFGCVYVCVIILEANGLDTTRMPKPNGYAVSIVCAPAPILFMYFYWRGKSTWKRWESGKYERDSNKSQFSSCIGGVASNNSYMWCDAIFCIQNHYYYYYLCVHPAYRIRMYGMCVRVCTFGEWMRLFCASGWHDKFTILKCTQRPRQQKILRVRIPLSWNRWAHIYGVHAGTSAISYVCHYYTFFSIHIFILCSLIQRMWHGRGKVYEKIIHSFCFAHLFTARARARTKEVRRLRNANSISPSLLEKAYFLLCPVVLVVYAPIRFCFPRTQSQSPAWPIIRNTHLHSKAHTLESLNFNFFSRSSLDFSCNREHTHIA